MKFKKGLIIKHKISGEKFVVLGSYIDNNLTIYTLSAAANEQINLSCDVIENAFESVKESLLSNLFN